ncbi:uncharacterized protein (TIGR02594 family) [Bradyrhizobium sp. GM24.11]
MRALIGAGARLGLGPVFGPAVGLALGNEIGVADSAIKRPGESTSQWRERQRKLRELRNYKTPAEADPLFQPSSYTGATDFSGRRRAGDLSDSLNKFTAKVERAAFINTGSSGLQYAAIGGASGGSGSGGLVHNYIGGVPNLMRSAPGQALPDFGVGRSGSIGRDKVPSFGAGTLSGSAFERKFAGTALAGKYDQVVAAARANGISPELLAGVIAHETGNGNVLSGNNVAGLMDPATGSRRKMQFGSLDGGIRKAGQVVAKNYRRAGGDLDKMGNIYAPPGAANDPRGLNGGWSAGVRKQMNALGGGGGYAGSGDALAWAQKYQGMSENIPTESRVLAAALGGDVRGRSNAWCSRFVNHALAAAGGKGTGSNVANSYQHWGSRIDPSQAQRNDVVLMTNGRGDNQPGGHVGIATGETRMVNGRLQVRMLAGNDSDRVQYHWVDAGPNTQVRRGNSGIGVSVPSSVTSQVPTPADITANVPSRINGDASLGLRGAGSGNTIHNSFTVHAGQHDPEAVATLVQRRIDEAMNWRVHDTSSEYT